MSPTRAEKRVNHMTAIELPDGEQIHRGYEQTEPCCYCSSMQVNRGIERELAEPQQTQQFQNNRSAKLKTLGLAHLRPHFRQVQANYKQRNRYEGSRDRA